MIAAAAAGNSPALQPDGGVPSRLLGADALTLSKGQPIERATATLLRTAVMSITSTLLYAAAVIAASFSPVAALAMLVFVPAMFNIPMLLRDQQS